MTNKKAITKTTLAIKNRIRKDTMKAINETLFKERSKHRNKLPHGFIVNLIKKMSDEEGMYEGISLNAVRCSFKRFCRSRDNIHVPISLANSNDTAPNSVAVFWSGSSTISTISDDNNTISSTDTTNTPTTTKRSKGGRPKGTTIEAKVHKRLSIEAAYNEIALIYLEEKRKAGGKVMYNTLKNIIKTVKKIVIYLLTLM